MKKKRTSTSFNWAISFIIFIPLVISLILSWVAYMRIHDFESNQKDIAHSTIERAGEDISNIIDENRRLVRLFASDEHAIPPVTGSKPRWPRVNAVNKKPELPDRDH
ncbi:MAG: hypothetical protein P8047_08380 [Gammaproteobacteria bacterium]